MPDHAQTNWVRFAKILRTQEYLPSLAKSGEAAEPNLVPDAIEDAAERVTETPHDLDGTKAPRSFLSMLEAQRFFPCQNRDTCPPPRTPLPTPRSTTQAWPTSRRA